MQKEKTIFEEMRDRYREFVYQELLGYISDRKNIRIIKCREMMMTGEVTYFDEEEATSFKIYKAPKSGYVKFVINFDHPKKIADTLLIYYKDRILSKQSFDLEYVNPMKSLTIEVEIGMDPQVTKKR